MSTVSSSTGTSSDQSVVPPSSFLDSALFYASLGYYVFPLAPKRKTPLFRDWPWQKNATTDQNLIKEWWSKNPNANVAIVCGKVSNLVVIDVDPKHDGVKHLAALEAEQGPMQETARQQTGSGGYHLLYRYPPSVEHIKNFNHGEIAKGVDVKADDGYIVAAPSVVTQDNGKAGTYRWLSNLENIAALQPWLCNRLVALTEGRGTRAKVQANSSEARDRSEESRNVTLTSEAGHLRNRGHNAETILEMLRAANRVWYSNHKKGLLPDNELKTIANSVGSYPANAPASAVPRVIDNAHDLQFRTFDPLVWLAENLVPSDGVTMLTDRPKKGKSWLALQLAFSIAGGKPFLGRFPVAKDPRRVLYFGLEDSPRRLTSRMERMPEDPAARHNIDFAYDLPLNADGITWLECHLELAAASGRPYGFVVIDTFLNACLQRKGGTDPVRADYQEIKLLRQLCQKHKIGILLVHHSRKAARGDDIGSLDQILGTTGVSAAVDSILLLATNNDGQRLMIVTGKDCALEDNQAMTFDPKASPPWSCQGSAFWLTVGMERTDVLTLLVSGPQQLGTLVTALGKKEGRRFKHAHSHGPGWSSLQEHQRLELAPTRCEAISREAGPRKPGLRRIKG